MASSFLDAFSLNPPPFPVLSILAVVSTFLGLQWFVSYDDVVESAKESFGWVLFAVRWLSSADESPGWLLGVPWNRERMTYNWRSDGASPWGVAALIILLLVLLQYQ